MSTVPFHGFIAVSGRGLVSLPSPLRKRLGLDRPGAQLEVTERSDGVIELRPMRAVPEAEAWFWDERWQEGEREVDRLIAAGRVIVSEGPEDFLASLPS